MDLRGDAAELVADLVERLPFQEAYIHQDSLPDLRVLLRLVRFVETFQSMLQSALIGVQRLQRLVDNKFTASRSKHSSPQKRQSLHRRKGKHNRSAQRLRSLTIASAPAGVGKQQLATELTNWSCGMCSAQGSTKPPLVLSAHETCKVLTYHVLYFVSTEVLDTGYSFDSGPHHLWC